MEKALEILYHIEELYSEKPDREVLEKKAAQNPERVQAWEDAFKDYDLSDVLDAIDDFWEFKSSKSRPSVAQIKAKLNARKVEQLQTSGEPSVVYFDPASRYMQRDINLGKCKCTLGKYNKAVKLIIRRLEDYVPIAELQKMDFAQKWQNVENKGLNADFDEVLEKVYAGDENIGAVTSSDDFGSVGAILAGHWRA